MGNHDGGRRGRPRVTGGIFRGEALKRLPLAALDLRSAQGAIGRQQIAAQQA